ncbi:ATP-binding protein [Enterococcus gallinarum]|uniref:ATP-binding protein n=1 Tax=Enterococcus gallinarum TaxID=1353 RepID=A0AAE4HQY2_ENTGA|nr:ATP-binding protein [Enterococcus gallinarum]MDT2682815.1 ATP-binding protein [Enterococcus gallinarum]MDT2691392.1 ATP-binding protein [Enterococcus gallinarum]
MRLPKLVPKIPFYYLEDNLVFGEEDRVYAYYEFPMYSYSFVGEDQAYQLQQAIMRLIRQSHSSHVRFFFCTNEEKIEKTIKASKELVRSKGELKTIAYQHLEGVQHILEELHGKYIQNVCWYVGIELVLEEIAPKEAHWLKEFRIAAKDFFLRSNACLFGDFETIPNEKIQRYKRLENLLYNRISKYFRLRKTTPEDMVFLVEHLEGKKEQSLDEVMYRPNSFKEETNTYTYHYDVLNLASAGITEKKNYLILEQGTEKEYITYLSLSRMTRDLVFPFQSEIYYFLQSELDFPIDSWLDVNLLDNRLALAKVRGKKSDLSDIYESGMSVGKDVGNNVREAYQSANELEQKLEDTREDLYVLSLNVRVSGKTYDEMLKRVSDVRNFFDVYSMYLEVPCNVQLLLHFGSYPAGRRVIEDYRQYVGAEFIASLGIGATQQLGDGCGIPIGFNAETGIPVFIQPWLAAQGIKGTVTNTLAKALIGSLGGGKSLTENLLLFWSVLFGALAFCIDPKSERSNWSEDLPYFAPYLKTVNITSEKENIGLLDPFQLMRRKKDQESLALDVLTYITGVSIRDEDRFPLLQRAVKTVSDFEGTKGLLLVIQELYAQEAAIAQRLAKHIESFKELSIAGLLFGDGTNQQGLNLDAKCNLALVQDLTLPDNETVPEDYNSSEILSIAIMMSLATYALDFIKQNRKIYKAVGLDESWAWLNVAQGKILGDKLVREGRSRNAGIDFSTQNTDDLGDEKMRSKIGLKFIFRSNDREEITKALSFCGISVTEENIQRVKNLENGECLFCDIHGNIGILYVYYWFEDLFHAFDTRPPMEETYEEEEYKDEILEKLVEEIEVN